jgi:predicted Zn-dependent protease
MSWKGFSQNYRLWKRHWLYPFISLTVAVSLCLTTPLPSKAIDLLPLLMQGTQILQLSRMSTRQEVELGAQMNDQLQSGEVQIYDNAQVNRYIEQIGRRLAANSDRPDIPYTFQVVDDDAINAFATVGGYVYVNKGLLKIADNEAEVASVLAHEIGHIGGKHLIKQMRQQAWTSGIASVAGLDRNTAVNLGVQLVLKLPRSRQDEFDADTRGLRTLRRTGYAPSAMVSFMQKLQGRSSTPTVLSTHPGTSDRIRALQSQIQNERSNSNLGLDSTAYRNSIKALLR